MEKAPDNSPVRGNKRKVRQDCSVQSVRGNENTPRECNTEKTDKMIYNQITTA